MTFVPPSAIDQQPLGVRAISISDVTKLAALLAKSSMSPFKGKTEDVFMAICLGMEIGLTPTSSLRAVSFVNEFIAVEPEVMLGIARRFTSDLEVELTETEAVGTATLLSGAEIETKVTREEATSKNRNRGPASDRSMEEICKARLARRICPDRLWRVFCPAEIELRVEGDNWTLLDELKYELLDAKSMEKLNEIGLRSLGTLSEKEQRALQPLFQRMKANLENSQEHDDDDVPWEPQHV